MEIVKDDYTLPSHYKLWTGMEAFEIHKKMLSEVEYIGFLKGNILKYQMRAGSKSGEPAEKDFKKMQTYKKELERILDKSDLSF